MTQALVESIPLVGGQFIAFMLGCIFGSFYNVVIYRLPSGQSIVRPASRCTACGNAIAPYDNIPLISYLLLGGKCRQCKESISLRYPLVEVLSGLLALLLFRRYGLHPQFPIEFFFCSLLLIVTMIDIDTFLIPDILSLSGIVAGFALSFFTPRLLWWESLLGIILGGGIFYLIAAGFALVRHKEGLGGGDIKLLAMIGAFIGWKGVAFTIFASSIAGTIIALPLMLRSGKGLGSALPFGPFLALGAVCYIFWGEMFYHWYFSYLLGM
ncbi:Type 4 prepilin-like proteins leader peptide-processing enzyme [Syntrophobacter sp. SbD1]|nr:Type 4 prepilin-like proteins leader peptide-processing enzyme [Syntrophobacter sp. SbD1]